MYTLVKVAMAKLESVNIKKKSIEEINKLYQPTWIESVKTVNKHYWVRNMARHTTDVQIVDTSDGSKELDRLITIQKFKDKGLSVDDIEKLIKYM
jgi:hypothetical protein